MKNEESASAYLGRLLKPIALFFILHSPFFIFFSCSPADRSQADKLNNLSYAYHYRSLDSTEHYATAALRVAEGYSDGRAEALNNLAFVSIARMQYDVARHLLDDIPHITGNQIELLVSYIQQMRLCQRMSQNRLFYDYREQAMTALRRIDEDRAILDQRQLARLVYAESELAIVTSTYYYYVGLERQSAEALADMPYELERDTAQWLNYLYNVGAGGMITADTQEEINQTEFDYLMRCLLLSQQSGIDYFMANSLEALAEHLMIDAYCVQLESDNLPAFKYINTYQVSHDSLAISLACDALDIFTDYGDVYQIAGAHRTLASCYRQLGDNPQALYHLQQALSDTIINQAPDLVASIREQLSVAYAAINDKSMSDYNRNVYLDLQEQTRQDRSLEARAGQLEHVVSQLNLFLRAVVAAIVLLILLLAGFIYHYRRSSRFKREEQDAQLLQEEQQEQLAMARLHEAKEMRLNLEQRARISLVNSILPFIDRILHEVNRLNDGTPTARQERVEYIRELTDKINEQNDILTHWIQLRQGQLSLHIETFDLQPLFDIVAMGRRSFAMKGITLQLQPTQARVKADKVLTLFMLNTLADNARKFTPQGGTVSIDATETDDYVEVAVTDTGKGMTDEQLTHVFDRKVISDDVSTQLPADATESSHGFGLINCKGIIEKYRKLSQIFSVCQLSAQSRVGEGSRFFFRLPKGMVHTLVTLLLTVATVTSAANTHLDTETIELLCASEMADSMQRSNINGTYDQTLILADSCRMHLNAFYCLHSNMASDTLMPIGDPSLLAPEIRWLHDSIPLNYHIILVMRNESAVAALSLHEWALYQYNNRIYTQLFKELSADNTLDDYCRKMQQSQTNKQIAILLLVFILVAILVAIAWQIGQSMRRALTRQQAQQERMEIVADEIARTEMDKARLHVSNAVLDNCLSALKHETMYYPSRIRQLIDSGDTQSLAEVTAYYRELYGILSLQAARQTETARLHLKPLRHGILGDEVLIDFLFDLLRKEAGVKKLDLICQPKNQHYVECVVSMPQLQLDESQVAQLFTPTISNIPYMLCRQIVRDHGEATNLRGCAIRAEARNGVATIIITLPKARKSEKKQT